MQSWARYHWAGALNIKLTSLTPQALVSCGILSRFAGTAAPQAHSNLMGGKRKIMYRYYVTQTHTQETDHTQSS